MSLTFYLFNAGFFLDRMRPALAESRRRRGFAPCVPLCAEVAGRFDQSLPEESLLVRVAAGLPFAKGYWDALVGELLVFGCVDMPTFPTAAETLCRLLAPGLPDASRAEWAPIRQAHFGSRDLRFGAGWYRPDHAGWNDPGDVQRLAKYLRGVDAASWDAAALDVPAEERDEELAFARDWWPSLVEMYETARGGVVVCEII